MKKFWNRISDSVQANAATGTANVLNLAIHMRTYKPSVFEQRLMAFALVMGAANNAQAQSAKAALQSVQTTVIGVVQVVFAIVLVIGLIRVVMKFVNSAPDALGSLGWLVGGVMLWFGFQFVKDDLVSNVGGGNTGGGVK